jgi:hypothetical protein
MMLAIPILLPLTLLVLGRSSTTSVEAARQAALDLALTALTKRLAINGDAVKVLDATPVEWPDAALGCPEKGMVYAQMVVPGYRLHLRVDDLTHDVHVGGGRAVVCGEPTPTASESTIATVVRLRDLARRDLALRLKLPEKDVQVTLVRPTTWPDAGLGCPEPGRTYETIETRGFLIELRARGKVHRYHSDQARVVACDERPTRH